jgi:hypothetical protein
MPPNQLSAGQVSELGEVLDKLAETLFGSALAERPTTCKDAALFVNRLRQEIGLALLSDESYGSLMEGAEEAVEVVGCE